MRNAAATDVVKVWLYALTTVLLGAWWSPVLFQGGKALAEVAARKQTNRPLDWLARWCTDTEFSGFFMVGLLLAAVVLWLPFTEWLRLGRREADDPSRGPWGIRVPPRTPVSWQGQMLRENPQRAMYGATGFLLAAGLFLLPGHLLFHTGACRYEPPADGWLSLLTRVLPAAFVLATVQEFLFRGVFMGIFLRAMRPAAAIAMSAALFAGIRHLAPPPDLPLADPEAGGLGFELLGKILSGFADPWRLAASLPPLLLMGLLLGHARWRTSSLWLPAGLHGGWIFAHMILARVTLPAPAGEWARNTAAGSMHQQELMSLAAIAITAIAVYFLTLHENPSPGSEA